MGKFEGKRVLVIGSKYSIFIHEFINKMKLYNNNIQFDLLCNDETYKAKFENGIVNNIYIYESLANMKNILNSMKKYDIVHIHYVQPLFGRFAELIKSKCEKLILSIWGSDFYKTLTIDRFLQKRLIRNANKITFANEVTLSEFVNYFGEIYKDKSVIARFGLGILDSIDDLGELSIKNVKSEFGIPKDAITICCGYNGTDENNHLKIIDQIYEIKDKTEKELFLLFPMTYGGEKYYINVVREKLHSNNLNYLIFDYYLKQDEISKIRIVSDIMINVRNTDQLSGSMQEHLYCNNIVINGSWLPYKVLNDKGAFFIEVNLIEDISSNLLNIIENLECFKAKCHGNKNIIQELSSWSKNIITWNQIYEEVVSETDRKSEVILRKFPFPYKAMFSISNDIDYMGLYEFCEIHKFLNTLEDTNMGKGLGLDVGDSFWMYKSSSLDTSDFIDYKKTATAKNEMSCFIDDDYRKNIKFVDEEIIKFVSAGWIDSIHTYGDFTYKDREFHNFNRNHAVEAIKELKKQQIDISVWIDHGSNTNIQKFGNNLNYDYHGDVTLKYGIKYVWNPVQDSSLGYETAITPKKLYDNQYIWEFRRHTVKNIDGKNEWVWNMDKLGDELSEENLSYVVKNGLYGIFAQHFAINYKGKFSNEAIEGLRRLKIQEEKGDILVTRISRLLEYNRIQENVQYMTKFINGILEIHINSVNDPILGKFIPTIEQCRGLTFYVDNPYKTKIIIGDNEIINSELQYNPNDGNGESISIRWFNRDYYDYSKEIKSKFNICNENIINKDEYFIVNLEKN